jgi:hypothetical protein
MQDLTGPNCPDFVAEVCDDDATLRSMRALAIGAGVRWSRIAHWLTSQSTNRSFNWFAGRGRDRTVA